MRLLDIVFCKGKFMHKYEIVAFITLSWAITLCNFAIFTVVKSAAYNE